jgi:NADPH2:quinone reductase
MHAIVCHEHGGPDVMRYEDVAQPEPATREVLIKADAIGVNYVDIMRRSGKHPAAPKTPFTPGIEVCGRVAAVGEEVSRFREGDRVIGRCVTHGNYAEFVCVEDRFTVACADALSADEGAALFVTGQTAYHALVTVRQTKPGEWVLITAAAGGVGLCAVQIPRLIAAAGSREVRVGPELRGRRGGRLYGTWLAGASAAADRWDWGQPDHRVRRRRHRQRLSAMLGGRRKDGDLREGQR